MTDQAVLVRHKVGKTTFELMTHPGSVVKFRKGEGAIEDVVYADVIFKNVSKGERAKAEELKCVLDFVCVACLLYHRTAYGTDDFKQVATAIAEKGDVQTTSDERKEKVEKRKREIGARRVTLAHETKIALRFFTRGNNQQ